MLMANFYSKPLQGTKFRILCNSTLNIDKTNVEDYMNRSNLLTYKAKMLNSNNAQNTIKCGSQECVGQNMNKNKNVSNVCKYCATDTKSWKNTNNKDMLVAKDIQLQRRTDKK